MPQTHLVPPDARPARADKALAQAFPEHSRMALQRAFEAALVRRNGSVISQKDTVRPGDALVFTMPEIQRSALRPAAIPLEILFEDRHLLALNKPAGMVVHPGAGTAENTLVHALLAHCAGELSGIGGVERPGIVHRLDRGTSGVMLVAKTDPAHRGLAAQFAARTVGKEYLALVEGVPSLLSGSIRKPIGRNPRQRHKMAVVEPGQGRLAHTDWEVVERWGDRAALLRCTIHTGRTHQIRVHLKAAGHGLIGDSVYGWKPDPRHPLPADRVMLHSEHLVFTHPVTGKTLDLRAPLPADFQAVLEVLRKENPGRPGHPFSSSSAATPQRRF
jgi:23S rRNA pseudouridine1911/1915/1917 synthase